MVLMTTTFADRNEVEPEPLDNTTTQTSPEESLNWEESESGKIFGLAQKHLAQENSKDALREFSEILEFFPNSSLWPKTCLQIFYIHLGNSHHDTAQQVLTRLLEKEHLPPELNMELLFAQWDFFHQIKDESRLNAWLIKRSPEEKKKLRTSSAFIQRFKQSLRDPTTPLLKLLQLWVSLKPPRPMESFILLHQPEKGFAFRRDQVNALLTKLLNDSSSRPSIDLISQVMNIMGKNGWASDAHQCFLQTQRQPELSKIWVRFLLKHQLYSEATETILTTAPTGAQNETKKPHKQDFSLEIIEANIGLQLWNEAAAAVKNQGSWVFSALPYPMTLQLFKGLYGQAHLQIQIEDLYQMLNPNLRAMVQVELEERQEKRESQLLELLEKGSLYGLRAAELLNTMYVTQRDQKKLSTLLKKLQKSHPNAKTIHSVIEKSIRTLNQLQPSRPSE